MKKLLTILLTALGLHSAYGQNFENLEVESFANVVKDSNVVILDVRTPKDDSHLLPKRTTLCKRMRQTGCRGV